MERLFYAEHYDLSLFLNLLLQFFHALVLQFQVYSDVGECLMAYNIILTIYALPITEINHPQ